MQYAILKQNPLNTFIYVLLFFVYCYKLTFKDLNRVWLTVSYVTVDYGLWSYRREDAAEPLTVYQQRLRDVYQAPENFNTHSNTEPSLTSDVFRYTFTQLLFTHTHTLPPTQIMILNCI